MRDKGYGDRENEIADDSYRTRKLHNAQRQETISFHLSHNVTGDFQPFGFVPSVSRLEGLIEIP